MMTPQNVIFVDSRQKEGYHDVKHHALESMGYQLLTPPAGLCVGGYSAIGSRYVVDTKANISELADNLSEYDANRFEWEITRAQRMNLVLVVVVTAHEYAQSLAGWRHGQCAMCELCNIKQDTGAVCPIHGELKPLTGAEVLSEIAKLSEKYKGAIYFEFVETEEQAAQRTSFLVIRSRK